MSRSRPGRAAAVLLALAAGAVVLAGCGGSTKPYTAAATQSCLAKKAGYSKVTIDASKVGLIAASSPNGGLHAVAADGNAVTIAFAADAAGARETQASFRRFASPFYKRHMSDVMESKQNAVLVWAEAPTAQQITDVESCLAS